MTSQWPRGPSPEVLQAHRIADLLQMRAQRQPDEVLYTYLSRDGAEAETLSYGQLYDDARRVATLMLEHSKTGDRALLLFGSGLDFVRAFMGCQVAGLVPVPTMPPRDASAAELGRITAIMDDIGARLIVTTNELAQLGRVFFKDMGKLVWLAVDDLDGVKKQAPVPLEEAGDLALLQYTSGSTSAPRGVMVGHDNLMHNLGDIYWAERNDADTVSVSWLPMSHDMGLIEGVLQPLYAGHRVVLMSPMAFLRRPLCWLEAISKYGATLSGGPNFAYELVLRRLGQAEAPVLDLSRWRFAYNGSEPVCASTIERFCERLAPRGFQRHAIHPLYGIAEATLGVTEGRHGAEPRFQRRTDGNGVRTVVSCGVTAPDMELVVVEPQTHRRLGPGEEGEIWLAGPCVTRGYWRQPEKTREVFGAQIKGSPQHYLRTGDLGFVVDGEVYISGRIKEVIMSRGRNIYPQDMEQTAERAHPFVRAGGVAAFRIEGPEEAAGIIAEIDRKALKTAPSPAQLERAVWDVRRSVAVTHGVPIEAVALVKPDTLPRTTSGKRQRLRIAQMWKQGEIQPLASIIRTSQEAPRDASLQGWLRGRVAALLGVEVSAIDTSCTLPELGLDSLRTLELLVSLEARFSGVPFAGLLTQSIDDLTSRMVEGKGSKAPWFEDAELPQDIRCANEAEAPASGRVLVTGATGFLGASIAIQVLETTDATLLCLVRGEGGEARLLTSLSNHPDWRPRWQGRVQAIEGDLTSPLLGLDEELYDGLAKGLDGIYHTAAMVNWVYPYRALSPTNVEGTRTLLRLACLNSTPFAYISTMAVCWSLGAVGVVDEDTDPMAHIDGIHLDYVRTKAVAEGLVRQAGSRGLPATIFRPGLIFSHSRTGQHSAGDFLSALFKGCIEMRAAPDLDWSLDVCPVDEVARIVVDRMKRSPGGGGTLHLEAPDRRLWRGAVLWMNLRGYDVKLLDYERWCERLETQVSDPTAALRPLYSFFTRPVEGLDGLRLPQLYEEGRRNPMSSEGSGVALEGQPRCRLDARQLEKTFDSLVDCGYLPAPQNPATPQKSSPPWSPAILEDLLQAHFADPRLRLLNATPRDWGDNPDVGNPAEHGIIGELASWRYGRSAGLYRFELSYQRGTRVETLPAVLKAQVPDRDTIDVGTEVAALCGAELGAAWETHREANEMLSSHLREPAIYALEDPELVAHRPVVYGARPGFLLLEDLTGMPLLDSADQPGRWQRPQIEAAIEGIAKVHSLWFGRPCAAPWLAPPRCSAALVAQASLWKALAGFACVRPFGRWLGSRGRGRYERLRLEIGAWSKLADSLPQTLIHNDFNPRNVALRDGVRLCAYDWELARVGLPQRDLAEFLCFTLTPDVTEEALTGWLELHRRALESAAGRPIDASRWRQGFGAALADFLVTRLPLYVMIDAFRPQHFLGRVVETWTRLDALAGFPTGGTK